MEGGTMDITTEAIGLEIIIGSIGALIVAIMGAMYFKIYAKTVVAIKKRHAQKKIDKSNEGYSKALGEQFLHKLLIESAVKKRLCMHLVNYEVEDEEVVFLDSGSTLTFFTDYINGNKKLNNLKIYSNNISAAHLYNYVKHKFYLFEGILSNKYGAAYMNTNYYKELLDNRNPIVFKRYYLACTRLRYETGIYADKLDEENKIIKQYMLEKFGKENDSILYIVITSEKLVNNLEEHKAILNLKEWETFREKNKKRIKIIVDKAEKNAEKFVKIKGEIEYFEKDDINVAQVEQ
jgi:hypothetical protein